LDPSQYPSEIKTIQNEVRSACREAGLQASEDPQAGVTIIDLDRDGSTDVLFEAWRSCEVEMKGAGCNTAGCDLRIFRQVEPHRWESVFDETVAPSWFLSASEEGYLRLLAVSISRKISDRCPDPSGSVCDFLLYWKEGRFVWERIR
jgi:hypothetical protein